jgi:hypothetical protein
VHDLVTQTRARYSGRRWATWSGEGMLALSDDIFRVDPTSILNLKVTGTWIQGTRTYALR